MAAPRHAQPSQRKMRGEEGDWGLSRSFLGLLPCAGAALPWSSTRGTVQWLTSTTGSGGSPAWPESPGVPQEGDKVRTWMAPGFWLQGALEILGRKVRTTRPVSHSCPCSRAQARAWHMGNEHMFTAQVHPKSMCWTSSPRASNVTIFGDKASEEAIKLQCPQGGPNPSQLERTQTQAGDGPARAQGDHAICKPRENTPGRGKRRPRVCGEGHAALAGEGTQVGRTSGAGVHMAPAAEREVAGGGREIQRPRRDPRGACLSKPQVCGQAPAHRTLC